MEREQAGVTSSIKVRVPIVYKNHVIPLGFRPDTLFDKAIGVETKAVTALLPAHEAQLLTHLRMSQIQIGLLMDLHATRLGDGLRRFVVQAGAFSVNLRGPPCSPC